MTNTSAGNDSAAESKRKANMRLAKEAKSKDLRPKIYVNATMHDQEEQLRELLPGHKGLFRYGGKIVGVTEHKDDLKLVEYTLPMLQSYISSKVKFFRPLKDGDEAEVRPPRDVVATLIDNPPALPEIMHVARAPVFTPSGDFIATSGYHEEIETYVLVPRVIAKALRGFDPDDVTKAEAVAAWNWLTRECFGDFPFRDEASLTHAMVGMMHTAYRPMFRGPTPPFPVDANDARVGKGLCTKVICFPMTGAELEPHGEPESKAEWKKAILARLMEAPSHIWFDNIEETLKSGVLASVMTAWPHYSDRLLGKSETVKVPNNGLWLLNGTNMTATTENAKRHVPIRLLWDKAEPPDERTGFRHPDLLGWMANNRGEIVRRIVTIIAWWVNSGMQPGHTSLGGFEGWSLTTAGILESIGVTNLLANRKEWLGKADVQTDEWVQFFDLWEEALKTKSFDGVVVQERMKAKDLLDMIKSSETGLFNVTDHTTARGLSSKLSAGLGVNKGGRKLGQMPGGGREYYIVQVKPGRPKQRKGRS